MEQRTAIETAAAAITSRVCRGFEPHVAAWAANSLRDVIVPRAFAGWQHPDDVAVREVIADGLAQFDADDPDERYLHLAIAYFEALLAPTAAAAFELAERCIDEPPARDEAAELIDEIHRLVEAIDPATNPDLYAQMSDDIGQAMADCLFAAGDRETPSRRLLVELMQRADDGASVARLEPPDPEIDRLAAQARASLAASWEAARFAADADLYQREQVEGVRQIYDHALELLEQLRQRFGDNAVRRITDDHTRADLLDALDSPITPTEWDQDDTLQGILFTRLSRSL